MYNKIWNKYLLSQWVGIPPSCFTIPVENKIVGSIIAWINPKFVVELRKQKYEVINLRLRYANGGRRLICIRVPGENQLCGKVRISWRTEEECTRRVSIPPSSSTDPVENNIAWIKAKFVVALRKQKFGVINLRLRRPEVDFRKQPN